MARRNRNSPPREDPYKEEREEVAHYDKTHPNEPGYQGRPIERYHKKAVSGLKSIIAFTAPRIEKVRRTGKKVSKAARKRSQAINDNFGIGGPVSVPQFGHQASASFGAGLHNMGAGLMDMSFSDPFTQSPRRGKRGNPPY